MYQGAKLLPFFCVLFLTNIGCNHRSKRHNVYRTTKTATRPIVTRKYVCPPSLCKCESGKTTEKRSCWFNEITRSSVKEKHKFTHIPR